MSVFYLVHLSALICVQSLLTSSFNQAVIEGDRANYEEYDYNDYDLYAYDEDETENAKKEHDLRQQLNQILSQLNSTTGSLPTPEPQRQRRPALGGRRRIQNGLQRRPYFEDVSSINFGGDFDDYGFSPNRRIAGINQQAPEDDFFGPGLNKIPGRIQTLNPYTRDSDNANFASFPPSQRRKSSGSNDCDFYTDSLCLEVANYPT